jgi:hypothetical protein
MAFCYVRKHKISVIERDYIYFMYHLLSLGRIQCAVWTGHGVTNHRLPGILEQRCRRLGKEEGGGAVSPATSKNWPQICFWCLLLLFSTSTKKHVSMAQLRGRRPWETSAQAALSHVHCETFTDIEDSSGSRFQQYLYIFFFRLANSYRRFKAASRLHLQDPAVQEEFP